MKLSHYPLFRISSCLLGKCPRRSPAPDTLLSLPPDESELLVVRPHSSPETSFFFLETAGARNHWCRVAGLSRRTEEKKRERIGNRRRRCKIIYLSQLTKAIKKIPSISKITTLHRLRTNLNDAHSTLIPLPTIRIPIHRYLGTKPRRSGTLLTRRLRKKHVAPDCQSREASLD